jgi:hypothetical protein
MASDALNDLLTIFNISTKADLRAHCRTAVIQTRDLANLILACQVQAIPIVHVPRFRHHHPVHLHPTDTELASLANGSEGKLVGDAAKFARKIDQSMRERRLFNAHLFVPVFHPSHWHLFYFDQRDKAGDHWKEGGSHLHLINMLTHPKLTIETLGRELDKERPHLTGGFHIRFRDED